MIALYAPLAPWILLILAAPFLVNGESSEGLGLVVITSAWSLLLDGPHVTASVLRLTAWSNLQEKRMAYARALTSVGLCAALLLLSSWNDFLRIFFVFSYMHICLQHTGFMRLIFNLHTGVERQIPSRLFALFRAQLWIPLIFRMLWGQETGGLPILGLQSNPFPQATLVVGGIVVVAIYGIANIEMISAYFRREVLPAHLIYTAALTPIHLTALFAPWPAIVCVMILTLGHNLQYLGFVLGWRLHLQRPNFRTVAHAAIFLSCAAIFTATFIRGNIFEWWTTEFKSAAHGGFAVTAQLTAAMGFLLSVFHYAMDSRMWKVRADSTLKNYIQANSQRSIRRSLS